MSEPVDADEVGPGNINAGRLWVGGFATAIVAALIVIVGVYIARGILNIPVLAPKAASNFGNSTTAVYAALAAVTTLVATALLHVLLLGAPRPLVFFTWITGLAVLAVAAAPFTQPASMSSKVFTCVLNVVAGLTVISLLNTVARTAIRRPPGPLPPEPGRPYPSDPQRRYPPDTARPYPPDPSADPRDRSPGAARPYPPDPSAGPRDRSPGATRPYPTDPERRYP